MKNFFRSLLGQHIPTKTEMARAQQSFQNHLNQQLNYQQFSQQFNQQTMGSSSWTTTGPFHRETPSQMLRNLEWQGRGQCVFCGNYDDNNEYNQPLVKALPKSMKGHREDCRFVLEIRPRIAYLELCESGQK